MTRLFMTLWLAEKEQGWAGTVRATRPEGDEMKIAAAGGALEILGHRRKEGPTLCKRRKG